MKNLKLYTEEEFPQAAELCCSGHEVRIYKKDKEKFLPLLTETMRAKGFDSWASLGIPTGEKYRIKITDYHIPELP